MKKNNSRFANNPRAINMSNPPKCKSPSEESDILSGACHRRHLCPVIQGIMCRYVWHCSESVPAKISDSPEGVIIISLYFFFLPKRPFFFSVVSLASSFSSGFPYIASSNFFKSSFCSPFILVGTCTTRVTY